MEYSFCEEAEGLVCRTTKLTEEASCSMMKESAGQASTHGSSRTLAVEQTSV